MNGAQFPLWQVDRREYDLVCAHLGLTPDGAVFDRLSVHLADTALTQHRPAGLARALARPPLTRWRIARLDLASRLLFPNHPVRHVINAVIALHECTDQGYAQLARTRAGAAVWMLLALEVLRFMGSLALTLPWLALQGLAWAMTSPFTNEPDLAGRRVLLTGIARGLGHDLLLECLERGATVIGTVRTEPSRRDVAAALPATAALTMVVADLSRAGDVVQSLVAAGVVPQAIDAAILCAGTKHDGHTVLDVDRLRDTVQVNLLSAAEIAAWLYAQASPKPAALGVVSSIGRWHGMHSTAGYNASKAALSIWAESLEMDLARRGGPSPTVTVIEPGLFESGMSRRTTARALLFMPRRRLAASIVDAVAAGRRSLRAPRWFTLVTWGVCVAGRGVRSRLFARAKT